MLSVAEGTQARVRAGAACAARAASAAPATMALGLVAGTGSGLAMWSTAPALFQPANRILATPLPATSTATLPAALIAVATADRAALRGLTKLLTAA